MAELHRYSDVSSKVSHLIESENIDVLDILKNEKITPTMVNAVKKTLLSKSKTKSGYDKQLYYKLAISVNMQNILELLNHLQTYLRSNRNRRRYNKEVVITDAPKSPQKPLIPLSVKERYSEYFYKLSVATSSVDVYIQTNAEYIKEKENLHITEQILKDCGITQNVKIFEPVRELDRLSKYERDDYVEFFRNF